ncbi:malate dehydrogenase [Syncephalis pseudoplumigaleata]|uniref:Malate dehydrogenase n=1 Tax=Syncephalis pseudoplumigaleata TaxID=1712513 RepID=A0A4P9Z4I7_9FUNG|nr:malate dehydrogenase [Syncephalis pseudoplumigaleata]|eukprot:RKP27497.1 malate dehydrogenase [Syncephalis pseudoplumigaleata]
MAKVTVLGAAGGIGQPLSLLMKQSHLVSHLALYDIVNVPGVAADLSHIDTPALVTGHLGPDQLGDALKGAQLVIIPAGIPRKPGMSRDELFKVNAGIVRDLATAAATHCPKAFMCIISNPVNSTVPIVAEVFKKHGVYDPKRLFGVTTLDVVRANTFLASVTGTTPSNSTRVPVVGGHAGVTIIPLFSRAPASLRSQLPEQQLKDLTHRVQYGGDEVVKAKDGAGSATLSMAFAGARFANALLRAVVEGASGVVEPSFVPLEADPLNGETVKKDCDNLEFFAVEVELGAEGTRRIHQLGELSPYEKEMVRNATPELHASIKKGIEFVAASKL